VDLEPELSTEIVDGLAARGHDVRIQTGRMPGWGPVSVIDIDGSGLRTGAADPRVDTASAAVR
jgi:gamma-glutamyltranspeptidase